MEKEILKQDWNISTKWVSELPTLDLRGESYAQYKEDLIALNIFQHVGVTNNFIVDIGAGGAGRNLSNSKLFLKHLLWNGLLFDMDGTEGTIKEFIKPDNIVELLKKNNCPKEFDFLSVDIDSFDYDIIDNVLAEYSPRLICAEYNGTLDPTIPVKLQYEDGYTWDGTNKYGFSFSAGMKLMAKHFYIVIFNHVDTNIFAIRHDLLPVGFEIKIDAKQNIYHPINPNAVFVEV